MLEQGVPREHVELACYRNALTVYGKSGQIREEHWLDPAAGDDRLKLYEGNSVWRGGNAVLSEDDDLIE